MNADSPDNGHNESFDDSSLHKPIDDGVVDSEDIQQYTSPIQAEPVENFSTIPVIEEAEEPSRVLERQPPVDTSHSVAWDRDWSPQRLANELKHIEDEIRELLEGRDPRRKRKFTGTRRWLELQEDLITMQFGDKFDQQTLARIQQLVRRRNSLFSQLRYLAGTRPTWNS